MNYSLGTIISAGVLSALAFAIAGPIGIIFVWAAAMFICTTRDDD